ncbi:SCO2523 family variant P-loop protein [Nocardia takedensis]|uniref:SCO2523 family variant P-loop protein n=1 Tax=Nocardia takedensis TaxID=259390 RepID=UPI0002DF91FD|nr:SCO2523 family variant P-loop protein [Nocardia takedensis]
MIVFATSDKGGTGRSVTSCNLGYHLSAKGRSVAYLDFDFGSPTAGALFELGGYERGVPPERQRNGPSQGLGLHSYLLNKVGTPTRVNVRTTTDREDLRKLRARGGQLVLFPGDEGGAEFDHRTDGAIVDRCVELLLMVERDFDVCLVDLSAGRSVAMDVALRATGADALKSRTVRWLVFHRWTRQHILAARGLVHGEHGLLDSGTRSGHDRQRLLDNIRFVRTAVPQLDRVRGGSGPQAAWLHRQDRILNELAGASKVGASALLGTVPVEPMLQWREQLILKVDVDKEIANHATYEAFDGLAERLVDERTWRPLQQTSWDNP